MKHKNFMLDFAEVFDSWRVVPRIMLFGYAWFVYRVTFYVLMWYTHEPATARGPEETAMVGVVVTAVTGFAPWILRIYTDSGRSWDGQQTATTTVTATTTAPTAAPAS